MSEFYRIIDDGEAAISSRGMSLLLGVPESAIRALAVYAGFDIEALPDEWVKSGLRRSKEYQAATGRSDLEGALEYWQAREGDGQ
ncbi:hypothetical protein [Rhodococcus zopfii]|uniref:hypothetical protein n=1 Tax=Rhodococcus zopfii TaxID=43772 RepID=UPI0011112AA6|nr:hypothetical protein [Rhodococcus zopfii]